MPSGYYSLADFPLAMVELPYDNCGRRGRLRKARLIAEYGPGIPQPDLRVEVVKCKRAGNMSDGWWVYYGALAPGRLKVAPSPARRLAPC